MSGKLEELALELLELPTKSRALLAQKLLKSLDEEESSDAKSRWMAEIQRRCAEIDEGKDEGIPAEDVLRELRERFP